MNTDTSNTAAGHAGDVLQTAADEVVRVLRTHSISLQRVRGEVLQIERHDQVSAGMDGRSHHVPIARVWKLDHRDQVLEAVHQAVAHMRVHQLARAL